MLCATLSSPPPSMPVSHRVTSRKRRPTLLTELGNRARSGVGGVAHSAFLYGDRWSGARCTGCRLLELQVTRSGQQQGEQTIRIGAVNAWRPPPNCAVAWAPVEELLAEMTDQLPRARR